MKYLLILLTILLFNNFISAQVYKYRSKEYVLIPGKGIKPLIANSNGKTADCDVLFVIDVNKNEITIYSESVQSFTIMKHEMYTNKAGESSITTLSEDEAGRQFQIRTGVVKSDKDWLPIFIVEDPNGSTYMYFLQH